MREAWSAEMAGGGMVIAGLMAMATKAREKKRTPASVVRVVERAERAAGIEPRPEIGLYRQRTTALLRRYFRVSMEVGRVPSVLGKGSFRAKVTSYRMSSFEDMAIFVHDVERCLELLPARAQRVIGHVVMQDCTHSEAAQRMGCTERTVHNQLLVALEQMGEIFLRRGILKEM